MTKLYTIISDQRSSQNEYKEMLNRELAKPETHLNIRSQVMLQIRHKIRYYETDLTAVY